MQRLQPHTSANVGYKWLQRPTDLSLFTSPSIFKPLIQVRCATHGAQGIANGPKNGPGKRLGAKKTGDEYVVTGNIIFRQRGTKWFPGENVGMGRDHTIFAMDSGFVKYYRDPVKHPKRQYIGVVFDKTQTLPKPQNAARRRRLGMVAVPRRFAGRESSTVDAIGIVGDISKKNADLAVAQAPAQPLNKRQMRDAKKRKMTGRLPTSELEIRSDYSYRESNWQIGRAAERAGIKVKQFRKGDRFLAWRKTTARRIRAAEKRAMGGKKKGKKDTAVRAGARVGSARK